LSVNEGAYFYSKYSKTLCEHNEEPVDITAGATGHKLPDAEHKHNYVQAMTSPSARFPHSPTTVKPLTKVFNLKM
jgi:SHS2 domain-containing protein